MADSLKPIPFVFWRSATGREPVREWLNEFSREDKRTIGRDIAKVQYGWAGGLAVVPSAEWRIVGSPCIAAKQAGGAGILRIPQWHADRGARDY